MTKIKKPEEMDIPENVIGCIYGIPGIGKTLLALSAPKPVLLLDTDDGYYRLDSQYRTANVVQVRNYEDILEVLEKEDLTEYKSIVIDTLGELINFMMKYFVIKNPSMITRAGTYDRRIYGFIKDEFTKLRQTMKKLNKNLIYVCHAKEVNDGQKTAYRMDVVGSSKEEVQKSLDFLGFMEATGNKRTIWFSPCDRFYTKNTIHLDDMVQVPTLDYTMENDFLSENVIKPSIIKRKEAVIEQSEIKRLEEQARKLIDAKNPNSTLDKWKSLDLNYYSKVKLFQELSTATSLQWNEESKRFE